MLASTSLGDLIRQAIGLLTARPLVSLGMPAGAYAVASAVPYVLPETLNLGVSVGMSIALSYVGLLVTAALIFDTNTTSLSHVDLNQNAQKKFILYFLFSVILGFALALPITIPLLAAVVSLFSTLEPILSAFDQDNTLGDLNYTQTLLAWTQLSPGAKSQVYWAFGLAGLIGFLLSNLLLTLWFLVPTLMVSNNQGLSAMGLSASLIRPHFWRVYVLSLIGGLIAAALIILPLILIFGGYIADNLLNAAFAGIFQGVAAAFGLSLAVSVWQLVTPQSQTSQVFS